MKKKSDTGRDGERPVLPTPTRSMNASREAAKARREEAEVYPLHDCFSARSSRRMESADCADGRRLIPRGSMPESASIQKPADEIDRDLVNVLG